MKMKGTAGKRDVHHTPLGIRFRKDPQGKVKKKVRAFLAAIAALERIGAEPNFSPRPDTSSVSASFLRAFLRRLPLTMQFLSCGMGRGTTCMSNLERKEVSLLFGSKHEKQAIFQGPRLKRGEPRFVCSKV